MSRKKDKDTHSKNQPSSAQGSGKNLDALGKMHSNLHNGIGGEAIASTQCGSAFYQERLKQAESRQEREQIAEDYKKHEEAQHRASHQCGSRRQCSRHTKTATEKSARKIKS